MKKIILSLILTAFGISYLTAGSIDSITAKRIARNFYYENSANKNILSIEAKLAATSDKTTLYYIFNINNNDGFVIVSADDAATPVLGYSLNGSFDKNNLAPALSDLLSHYSQQILYIKENNLKADKTIKNSWKNYSEMNTENGELRTVKKDEESVYPLITTTWNQKNSDPYCMDPSCYTYNAFCPSDASGAAVTGCVATAMAQIMRYWKHPVKGRGQHSFYHPIYGHLSANFAAEPFDWDHMPNMIVASSPPAEIKAVAGIAYHCGISLDMDYSATSSGTTNMHQVIRSLVDYFYYSPSTRFERKIDYDDAGWLNLLKYELKLSRPMQFQGWLPTTSGHAFICDGFDKNNFLHFNFGWGGSSGGDGYYLSTNIHPKAYDFNYNVKAIMGIQPINDKDLKLELASDITINPATILYGKPFSVKADIKNSDTASFTGSFAAFLYDDKNNFYLVDTTDVLTLAEGATLTGGLTFASEGIPAATPGTYKTGILYRPVNGDWLFADTVNFKNMKAVDIVSEDNKLKLSAYITFSKNPIVKGQAFDITSKLTNTGTPFTGDIAAVFYSESGDSLLTIKQASNVTINTSASYNVSFKTNTLTNDQNGYVLSLLYREAGTKWMQVASSGSFINPIWMKINPAKTLTQDKYEPNTYQNQAYTLSLTFVNDQAYINTEGSNIHNSSDYDFYKMNLDSNYTYSFSVRLNDKDDALDGQKYTTDVSVRYRFNNDISDYLYPTNDFIINQKGTVYLEVKPFFVYEPGTYKMDINVSRVYTSVKNIESGNQQISVYPNPANDHINIDLKDSKGETIIELYSILGKLVYKESLSTINHQLSTKFLNDGMYILKLNGKDLTASKKIVIKH